MDINLPTIIQGGAVGLSILLIGLVAYLAKLFYKFLSNHISHNTEALNKVNETLRELCVLLRRNNK